MTMRALALVTTLAAIGFAALILLSETYLAQGQGILDGRFGGYSVDDVHAYLTILPQAARDFYVGPYWLLDTVVPTLIALSMGGLIWTYGRGMVRGLVVLAPAYLVFDLVENVLIRRIVTAGAEAIDPDIVTQASAMTQGKWVLILSLIGSAIVLWRKERIRT